MDNKQLAQSVLNVIGPENISDTYNCMTRLRLSVTSGAVRKDDLKKIPGVKGVIINGDEVQIVLGPGKAESVAKECKTLLAGKIVNSTAGNPSAETGALNRREKDSPNAVSAESGKTNFKNINPNLGNSTADRSKNFGDGKELHDKIKKKNSQSAFKRLLQRVGHIFIPLIPAFIGCGLLTGIVTLLLKI
ncbi:MAG: PTS transporter subunit EIIB, partial [Acidaminococcaceae bacterium]|nr:PTS transporter subunit EIIB [Acidaminococcaceae bacterium]